MQSTANRGLVTADHFSRHGHQWSSAGRLIRSSELKRAPGWASDRPGQFQFQFIMSNTRYTPHFSPRIDRNIVFESVCWFFTFPLGNFNIKTHFNNQKTFKFGKLEIYSDINISIVINIRMDIFNANIYHTLLGSLKYF